MRYHYRVGGKDYEGDGFKIGGKSRAGGLVAKALIKKYPECRDVDVYYDPADPARSSLEEKGSVTVTLLPASASCASFCAAAGSNLGVPLGENH